SSLSVHYFRADCRNRLTDSCFAITLLGVALTSQLSAERDLRMAPGDSVIVGEREVRFLGVNPVNGPNYIADQGNFVIVEGDRRITLRPEKRNYLARRNVMTEAAIDPGFTRDVYLSLGEPLEAGAWAIRIQVKPFVRWIWLGALLMALGGVVAVADARYRRLKARDTREAPAPMEAAAGAAS
ncbi:MAG: cytochrome c-type biogenesis CcmF C-terminal domain-containing protein, partial [Pseudomonadota bacterium]